jgi:hypothetical protein
VGTSTSPNSRELLLNNHVDDLKVKSSHQAVRLSRNK